MQPTQSPEPEKKKESFVPGCLLGCALVVLVLLLMLYQCGHSGLGISR